MELLHFKQILKPSIIQSVDGDLFALVSKAFLAAAIPLSLLILGYMFTNSKETKIVLSGHHLQTGPGPRPSPSKNRTLILRTLEKTGPRNLVETKD